MAGMGAGGRKQGDRWILDGDKSYAAAASRGGGIVGWAGVDTKLGREGRRAFVVERGTNGLGDFSVERKMGLKAYESTSFTLRECRVPAANLLGGEAHYAKRAGFKPSASPNGGNQGHRQGTKNSNDKRRPCQDDRTRRPLRDLCPRRLTGPDRCSEVPTRNPANKAPDLTREGVV